MDEWDQGYQSGHYDGYGDAVHYEESQVDRVIEVLDKHYRKDISDQDCIARIKEVLYFYPEIGFPDDIKENWSLGDGQDFPF